MTIPNFKQELIVTGNLIDSYLEHWADLKNEPQAGETETETLVFSKGSLICTSYRIMKITIHG